MKKGFIAFVKALFGVAKVVLAILGVLVLAVVASLLLSIPGGKRFSRYCSYPEKPKQETALIPCGGLGATTTAWDALTNVCNSVGCRFKVYPGKVEIGKMTEKYDQVHILNSSSRRKQQ